MQDKIFSRKCDNARHGLCESLYSFRFQRSPNPKGEPGVPFSLLSEAFILEPNSKGCGGARGRRRANMKPSNREVSFLPDAFLVMDVVGPF